VPVFKKKLPPRSVLRQQADKIPKIVESVLEAESTGWSICSVAYFFDQLYSPKGRHNNKIKKNRKYIK